LNRLAFFLASAAAIGASVSPATAANHPKNRVSGIVVSVTGNTVVLRKRNGTTVTADLTLAVANASVGVVAPNHPIVLHGTLLANGTFQCTSTSHAGPKLTEWADDQ
jgi:RNase P/RNase MRP subunit p29